MAIRRRAIPTATAAKRASWRVRREPRGGLSPRAETMVSTTPIILDTACKRRCPSAPPAPRVPVRLVAGGQALRGLELAAGVVRHRQQRRLGHGRRDAEERRLLLLEHDVERGPRRAHSA